MADKPIRMHFLNRTHITSESETTTKRTNCKGLTIRTSIPVSTALKTKHSITAQSNTDPLPSPFLSHTLSTEGSSLLVSGPRLSSTSPSSPSPESYSQSSDETAFTAFVVSTIISSFLYLGPEPSSVQDVEELKKIGVRRVLNMAVECEDGFGMKDKFEVYRKLGIRDTVEEQVVAQDLNDACAYIDDALLHGCPIYIHCRAGRSRSVMVVLAYLIRHYRWPLKTAYAYVLERRRGISPNIGFMAELMAFEENELVNSAPTMNKSVNKV
ncbi:map kinase phosphatase [Phaffia rhodozyma]|uniref:protein-tyrosine-phosphatase n=1 Tax=Phaffia rhodozyma TaxID=264483 RepID=A0A0F7SMN7_PHARH|nr:map kinase phosphatase [Phaffia rhodozyma]